MPVFLTFRLLILTRELHFLLSSDKRLTLFVTAILLMLDFVIKWGVQFMSIGPIDSQKSPMKASAAERNFDFILVRNLLRKM
jgi:hypothetical protein